MLSTFDYHCPHCTKKLNNESEVAFLVRYENKDKSQLTLAKRPGAYGYKSTHDLNIKNGDKVSFFCSHCEADLQSKKRPKFIEIELWTNGNRFNSLYFSPICGERVSYVEAEGELMGFGADFISIMEMKQGI